MAKWYWRQWRTFDHIEQYARLWLSHGPTCFAFFAFFWGSSLAVFMYNQRSTGDPAVYGVVGMGIGVGAFFAAAGYVLSLANSTQIKLKELNERIENLENRNH